MADDNGSILVIEDDRQISEMVGAYAQLCGYRYRQALDGKTAISEARRVAPDAVILDLMLPDVDGYEVCRQLRSEHSLQNTPIIILSALSSQRDKDLGRACGADAYLTKPFNPDELMQTLKDFAGHAPTANVPDKA